MKKILLIKNPELFQGEKNLNKGTNYFEGWYFKNINGKKGISFIPGISINNRERQAFIQIITNSCSYFVKYNINDFKYNHNPFYIKIGDSYFASDKIHIDIKDREQNLIIYGDIKYNNSKNIDTNILNPNIMGIFSYVLFMECNHAIISMKNNINGRININNENIYFNNDIGYIEKDWGSSFPKSYIWCQGNNFYNSNISFMLSIADIPFKLFSFRGIICSLIIGNREYRFATYNRAKLIKFDIRDNIINIVLKKNSYYLYVEGEYSEGYRLIAPIKGNMEKDIIESISSRITITLKRKDRIIYTGTSINCGLEIVK